MRTLVQVAALAATLSLTGCGGAPTAGSPAEPTPVKGAGAIHAVVQTENGISRSLAVDYAAAGLGSLAASPEDEGSLVIVGVFRDGRIDESLDLETLSISVPLSELPGQHGTLDVVVDGASLAVLLEGTQNGETLVLSPDRVEGSLHLRYDAPPRPGITLRGDFTLLIPGERGSTLKLDGELDLPVLGN